VHTQVDLLEKGKAAARAVQQSPGNRWLPAEVKAGAFYGRFNSGLG
jgi:hypothetical protein